MTVNTEYLELIKDFQNYLSNEHPVDSWMEVSKESYDEYKNWFIQSKTTPQIKQNSVVDEKRVVETTSRPEYKKQEYKKPEYKKPEYKAATTTQVSPLTEAPLKEEKKTTTPIIDFFEIRKIIHDKLPDLHIIETIPDDSNAKTIKSEWKQKDIISDLIFIVNGMNSHQHAFMKNVCAAIYTSLNRHAKIFDKKNSSQTLESCPSIVIEDIDLYFKEPLQKKELWNLIKKTVNAL